MLDPLDMETIEFLRSKLNAWVVPYFTTPTGLKFALRQYKREIGKELGHFLGAFDVVRVVLHPEAFFVVYRGVGLNADVNVLEWGLDLADIVGVVGHHQRNIQVPAQAHQSLIYL